MPPRLPESVEHWPIDRLMTPLDDTEPMSPDGDRSEYGDGRTFEAIATERGIDLHDAV
jgi:hypothetical protein